MARRRSVGRSPHRCRAVSIARVKMPAAVPRRPAWIKPARRPLTSKKKHRGAVRGQHTQRHPRPIRPQGVGVRPFPRCRRPPHDAHAHPVGLPSPRPPSGREPGVAQRAFKIGRRSHVPRAAPVTRAVTPQRVSQPVKTDQPSRQRHPPVTRERIRRVRPGLDPAHGEHELLGVGRPPYPPPT